MTRWICPSCNKSTCVGCEPREYVIYDEMEDRPNPEDERAEAWEYWHERANKFEAEALEWRKQAQRHAEVIGWIDAWISNPVGSYSIVALDGLFSMTRDKIAALSAGNTSQQRSDR